MGLRGFALSAALAAAVTLGAAAVHAEDTIKIGGIFPLTGPISWVGDYYKKATELQVEMINEKGGVNGRKLELISLDDHSSPEGAVRTVQRLIESDKVVALVGTASVPMSGAVATVVGEKKIPTIVMSGYSVDPKKDSFIFNTAYKTEFVVERAFSYFAGKGSHKVALFMPLGPLGDVGASAAEAEAKKTGVEIVAKERFNPHASDLTGQLAQLRASKPDFVFSFVTGEPAAMVARNMQQIGFNVPLIVSHGNATPGFLKMVAAANPNIIVPTGPMTAPDTLAKDNPSFAAIKAFNVMHQKKYGEPANYFSGMAADAIRLIADAIAKAKSTNGTAVRDAIEGIEGLDGYSGVYHMSATDHYGLTAAGVILVKPTAAGWKVVQ